jgi:carbon storage regulator
MLVLTRSKGQRIVIGDDVVVTVLSVGRTRCTCEARNDGVRIQLGIDAPRDVRVVRGEIFDTIRGANLAATTGTEAGAEALSEAFGQIPGLGSREHRGPLGRPPVPPEEPHE